jgi:hypothetical protein
LLALKESNLKITTFNFIGLQNFGTSKGNKQSDTSVSRVGTGGEGMMSGNA